MEGQPDIEPRDREQMDCERERAEDEWKRWQRGQVRNTLHLMSAVAQWILLLACLIYLGIGFLRPSTTQSNEVPWTHIRYTGKSTKGVAMNLTAELGPIQIRNGSIVIPCDGLYLVSLESSIYLEKKDLLTLTLQKTHKTTRSVLWEQTVQSSDSETTVNLITVLFLFGQDTITLRTDSNASANISDLSFSLVLVSDTKCRL